MQQQIDVIVKMTYQADSTLSRDELIQEIYADLARLLDPDSGSQVELCESIIEELKEEAEIYGNE